ncbi:SIS domain-containing protein, partial [Pseudomonadota bacterium]
MIKKSKQEIIALGKNAVEKEIEGLNSVLTESINDTFIKVVNTILKTKGRIIVSGMGKAGYIGNKFSATLASTGTPAFFIHPSEASHGDLGMIRKDDTVILLSNSGGSKELNDIINYCNRFSITLIGITRKAKSVLNEAANIKVVLRDIPETNPVNSPTTSMIMMVAYCDAIITTLIGILGFNQDSYKILHPGGKLGSALIKVDELMKKGNDIPLVKYNDKMSKVLKIMTEKKLGCTGVLDSKNNFIGIITDGDLRRKISITKDFMNKKAEDIMTKNPITVEKGMFIGEIINIMNTKSITAVFIIDPELNEETGKENVVGILHM